MSMRPVTPASPGLQGRAEEELARIDELVRSSSVDWYELSTLGYASMDEARLVGRYATGNDDIRIAMLESDLRGLVGAMIKLLEPYSTRPDAVRYILMIMVDITKDNKNVINTFIDCFRVGHGSVKAFIEICKRSQDPYMTIKASTMAALLLCDRSGVISDDLHSFMAWIRANIISQSDTVVLSCLLSLMTVLRDSSIRLEICQKYQLVRTVVPLLLSFKTSVQILYQTGFVLWLMTYEEELIKELLTTTVVSLLLDTIKTVSKEKVVRICLSTLRNTVEHASANEDMINFGGLKILFLLSNKKWSDPDVAEDIDFILESLNKNIKLVSTFDVYRKEVLSGNLEWSPVHKSEMFWRENVSKFEQNDFQVLRVLVRLLQMALAKTNTFTPQEKTSLCVACFDVGEFIRYHPRGKLIMAELQGKEYIMQLMTHEDKDVQREALLAVQKLMTSNWEMLQSKR